MLYGDIEIFAFVLLFWIIYETSSESEKDANYAECDRSSEQARQEQARRSLEGGDVDGGDVWFEASPQVFQDGTVMFSIWESSTNDNIEYRSGRRGLSGLSKENTSSMDITGHNSPVCVAASARAKQEQKESRACSWCHNKLALAHAAAASCSDRRPERRAFGITLVLCNTDHPNDQDTSPCLFLHLD